MSEYNPGVCNIGRAEVRKRYALGGAGLAAAAVYVALAPLDPVLDSVIAGLLFLAGFEGVFQGYFSFCTGFAQKGVYDVSESGGERHDVEEDLARKKDIIRAVQIHLYSLTSALSVTAFLYMARVI